MIVIHRAVPPRPGRLHVTLGGTLCTTATCRNGTGSAATSTLFDRKLQDPNGAILKGGSASGDVCFDAPQGGPAGQYVVLLDPSFSFTSERVAWLGVPVHAIPLGVTRKWVPTEHCEPRHGGGGGRPRRPGGPI